MDLHATKVSYLARLLPLPLFLLIDFSFFSSLSHFYVPRDNYVIQCNESTDCSDLYIQTEIKDLRINGPLPSVQCQEENSTDVVSIALVWKIVYRGYQCTDLHIKVAMIQASFIVMIACMHFYVSIFPIAFPISVPIQDRIFS